MNQSHTPSDVRRRGNSKIASPSSVEQSMPQELFNQTMTNRIITLEDNVNTILDKINELVSHMLVEEPEQTRSRNKKNSKIARQANSHRVDYETDYLADDEAIVISQQKFVPSDSQSNTNIPYIGNNTTQNSQYSTPCLFTVTIGTPLPNGQIVDEEILVTEQQYRQMLNSSTQFQNPHISQQSATQSNLNDQARGIGHASTYSFNSINAASPTQYKLVNRRLSSTRRENLSWRSSDSSDDEQINHSTNFASSSNARLMSKTQCVPHSRPESHYSSDSSESQSSIEQTKDSDESSVITESDSSESQSNIKESEDSDKPSVIAECELSSEIEMQLEQCANLNIVNLTDSEYEFSDDEVESLLQNYEDESINNSSQSVDEQVNLSTKSDEIIDQKDAVNDIHVPQLNEESLRSWIPPQVTTQKNLDDENAMKNRVPFVNHPMEKSTVTGKPLKSTDDPNALTAPSVSTKLLSLPTLPKFDDVFRGLGTLKHTAESTDKARFVPDRKILTENPLKKLIMKRAEILVVKKEAKQVDQATQIHVTFVEKQHAVGYINGRSAEHHFKDCSLPYRPGFCQICGIEGFDTHDYIYPHGIEHEMALHRCPGCSRELDTCYPEFSDCHILHAGHSDWLRPNHTVWPTWLILQDHRYPFENDKISKRKVQAKFTYPEDHPNPVRAFLMRENTPLTSKSMSNLRTQSALQLSKEKRQRARRPPDIANYQNP